MSLQDKIKNAEETMWPLTMGMSIDDAIKEVDWSKRVHKKILETDAKELDIDSAWVKHWESVVGALDIAIETMRKYQKIQEIIKDWEDGCFSDVVGCLRVKAVLDGNDD